jgi:hypothetical protein
MEPQARLANLISPARVCLEAMKPPQLLRADMKEIRSQAVIAPEYSGLAALDTYTRQLLPRGLPLKIAVRRPAELMLRMFMNDRQLCQVNTSLCQVSAHERCVTTSWVSAPRTLAVGVAMQKFKARRTSTSAFMIASAEQLLSVTRASFSTGGG